MVDFRLSLGPPLFRGGAQRDLISRTAANLDHWELALYKYCTLLLYCILIIEPKRVVEGQHYHYENEMKKLAVFWNKSILPCILTSLLLSSRILAFLKPWSIYPTFFFWWVVESFLSNKEYLPTLHTSRLRLAPLHALYNDFVFQFCGISIVFNFTKDYQSSLGKVKTKVMQNVVLKINCIYCVVFCCLAYATLLYCHISFLVSIFQNGDKTAKLFFLFLLCSWYFPSCLANFLRHLDS